MNSDKKSYRSSLLDRAVTRKIRLGPSVYDIWMVLDMDALIDDFIEIHSTGERPDCPYGATLWPSTRAFADWAEKKIKTEPKYFSNIEKAVDLGCGVGVGSCLLAKYGVKEVIATDAVSDLDFLVERNAKVLGVDGKVHFKTLDWSQQVPAEERHSYPLVLACDVLYEQIHLTLLPRIAHSLVHPDGVFYLGDPKRYCFESAVAELKKYFSDIQQETVVVENESADVKQGVVNLDCGTTSVQILSCRRPR